jgi:hypothetical protein
MRLQRSKSPNLSRKINRKLWMSLRRSSVKNLRRRIKRLSRSLASANAIDRRRSNLPLKSRSVN